MNDHDRNGRNGRAVPWEWVAATAVGIVILTIGAWATTLTLDVRRLQAADAARQMSIAVIQRDVEELKVRSRGQDVKLDTLLERLQSRGRLP